jgi:hypothetical protein
MQKASSAKAFKTRGFQCAPAVITLNRFALEIGLKSAALASFLLDASSHKIIVLHVALTSFILSEKESFLIEKGKEVKAKSLYKYDFMIPLVPMCT